MSDWKEVARPEILTFLRQYCIAFWCVEYPEFKEKQSEPKFEICGGSGFLWQTECGKFLVTAYHVWAEFRDRILERPDRNLIFYLDGNHAFPLLNIKLVSEGRDLDLAVLGGPGIELLQLDEKAFFKQPVEVPADVLEADRLALLGYPKVLRISEAPYNTIGIVYMQGSAIVSEYGLRFRMAGNTLNKYRSSAVPSLEDFEMPGCSGGPVFVFRPGHIEWAGIVSEVGGAPHFDVVIVPSKFIGSDGIIIRPSTML